MFVIGVFFEVLPRRMKDGEGFLEKGSDVLFVDVLIPPHGDF
jgi:hypothetical protein